MRSSRQSGSDPGSSGPTSTRSWRRDCAKSPGSATRSIFVAHHDVGGVDFWGETPKTGKIISRKEKVAEEKGDRVTLEMSLSWQSDDGKEVVREERTHRFFDLPGEELALELECRFRAAGPEVTLGITNFGFLGIRVAKTMRVHEKLGGRITNSNDGDNETGCFGQHAEWCDYSGPVPIAVEGKSTPNTLPAVACGIACFDHPKNREGGSMWHVRDDGWMGPSYNRSETTKIGEEALDVRFRLESHAGYAHEAGVAERYREWRKTR
jgi:hypothetical protein